jgi:hypothetical protein
VVCDVGRKIDPSADRRGHIVVGYALEEIVKLMLSARDGKIQHGG